MKLKQMIADVIEGLEPEQMLAIYNVAIHLEHTPQSAASRQTASAQSFLKAREYLRGCTGNLSDDIMELRADRL